jgi:hypothetical protein
MNCCRKVTLKTTKERTSLIRKVLSIAVPMWVAAFIVCVLVLRFPKEMREIGLLLLIGAPLIAMFIFAIAGSKTDEPESLNITIDDPPMSANRPRNITNFSDDHTTTHHLAGTPLPHALIAVENTRTTPKILADCQLIDIGFIASWDENTPYTFRTTPIPYTVRMLFPYVQLRLNYSGAWEFTFEVSNFRGEVVSKREIKTSREAKLQLIMPSTMISIPYANRFSVWTLGFRVNGELIALHRFTWRDARQVSVETAIESDGELDEEMLAAARLVKPMSVDELLSEQDDEQADKR